MCLKLSYGLQDAFKHTRNIRSIGRKPEVKKKEKKKENKKTWQTMKT